MHSCVLTVVLCCVRSCSQCRFLMNCSSVCFGRLVRLLFTGSFARSILGCMFTFGCVLQRSGIGRREITAVEHTCSHAHTYVCTHPRVRTHVRAQLTHTDDERTCILLSQTRQARYIFLTSQQYASVFQGRIYSDNSTCRQIGTEVTDQTVYLIQSQYTDTRPASPSADLVTPGAWQDSHWSTNR